MQKYIYIFVICLLLLQSILQAKLLIITHNYNQPTFIELQYRLFKKFLHDDFEYVVFNDAIDPSIACQIDTSCKLLDIQCYRVPQEDRTPPNLQLNLKRGIFWAAARHAEAIRYSMDTVAFNHQGLVMMIDSDMFLIKSFDTDNFIKDNDIAGLRQVRDKKINYLWGGLIFFRMDRLPDKESMTFKNGLIDCTYVDSCGFMHYYFQAHPEIKILYFDQDFRHIIDENLRSLMLPTHYNGNKFKMWQQYIKCNSCKAIGCRCFHSVTILKELNFDETIIKYAESKTLPPKIEFVLKDTFLHYQDGSNYAGNSCQFVQHKKELFLNFITDILNRVTIEKDA